MLQFSDAKSVGRVMAEVWCVWTSPDCSSKEKHMRFYHIEHAQ